MLHYQGCDSLNAQLILHFRCIGLEFPIRHCCCIFSNWEVKGARSRTIMFHKCTPIEKRYWSDTFAFCLYPLFFKKKGEAQPVHPLMHIAFYFCLDIHVEGLLFLTLRCSIFAIPTIEEKSRLSFKGFLSASQIQGRSQPVHAAWVE